MEYYLYLDASIFPSLTFNANKSDIEVIIFDINSMQACI
jgi:hypothetical protein